jgi:hypothetical protein
MYLPSADIAISFSQLSNASFFQTCTFLSVKLGEAVDLGIATAKRGINKSEARIKHMFLLDRIKIILHASWVHLDGVIFEYAFKSCVLSLTDSSRGALARAYFLFRAHASSFACYAEQALERALKEKKGEMRGRRQP